MTEHKEVVVSRLPKELLPSVTMRIQEKERVGRRNLGRGEKPIADRTLDSSYGGTCLSATFETPCLHKTQLPPHFRPISDNQLTDLF